MEIQLENKQLEITTKVKSWEKLGSKIAIIISKAQAKCNKVLNPTGYGIEIQINFIKLDQPAKPSETEMTNG